MSNLQSDIDYMKSLAESGGRGPLRNGAILFCAGLSYGLAAIAHYAMIRGFLPQSTATAMIIWFGASALFTVLAFVFCTRQCARGGSVGNRAMKSAWTAVGIGICSYILCTVAIAVQLHNFEPLSYMVAPGIFVLYGMGWWVCAIMSETRWLRLVSLGCFLAAPALALLAGHAEQMLAYAAGLFLFAMLPGLILMRAQKAA